MPAELTPDIDPSDVAASIHHDRSGAPESLRASGTRRTLLERYGSVLADGEIDLTFETTNGETAHVELGSSPPQVHIPVWEFDQPVTEIPKETFDLLIQQTLTVHEVGHINYTDNAAFGRAKQSLPPEERPAFHRLFNVLEDGAIEEQLRSAFDVADELAVTNANFRFSYDDDNRQYDQLAALQLAGLDLAVFDSGVLGKLLDPADGPEFVDKESRRTFCGAVLPALADAVPDILSEPDGGSRVDQVLDLWKEIREHIDSLEPPKNIGGPKGSTPAGGSGSAATGAPADGLGDSSGSSTSDNSTGEAGGSRARSENADEAVSEGKATGADSTAGGDNNGDTEGSGSDLPDERSTDGDAADDSERSPWGSESGKKEAASDSPRDQSDDPEGRANESQKEEPGKPNVQNGEDRPAGKDADSSNEEWAREGPKASSGSNSESAGGDATLDPNSDLSGAGAGGSTGKAETTESSEEIRERARQAAEEISGSLKSQEREDAKIKRDYEDAANEFIDVLDGIDRRQLTIETPDVPFESGGGRWQVVRRDGERLGRVFKQRLQNERRNDRRRRERRGKLDPRALSRLQRKDPRVFQSDDFPDEKEYAIILVLDRSSSMSSMIGVAERAVATLAYALESIGVDVCVLDVYRSSPRVAKPFAVDIQDVPEVVLTGETGGGTPLAGVLAVARKRVSGEEYHPAMITVTDGKPNDEEAYREQLRQTRFPVLGVYIDLSARSRDRVLRRNQESGPLYDQRTIVIDGANLTDSLESMAREVMF